MARKIKTRAHKPKVRGHRQHQAVQRGQQLRAEGLRRDLAFRVGITGHNATTGERYTLGRLSLRSNADAAEYKQGLDEAVGAVDVNAQAQAEAIRVYLQGWVDQCRLIAVPLSRGERPSCRVYQGDEDGVGARIEVIRQDDPEVMK